MELGIIWGTQQIINMLYGKKFLAVYLWDIGWGYTGTKFGDIWWQSPHAQKYYGTGIIERNGIFLAYLKTNKIDQDNKIVKTQG